MKNIKFYFGLALVCLTSCNSPMLDDFNENDDKSYSIECYQTYIDNLYECVYSDPNIIGMKSFVTRSEDRDYTHKSILQLIMSLDTNELDTLLNNPSNKAILVSHENSSFETLCNFIDQFNADDFCRLRDLSEKYFNCGGHNIELFCELTCGESNDFIDYFSQICAWGDILASSDEWLYLSSTITRTSDFDCKREFQERLLAVAVSDGLGLGITIGAAIPGAGELAVASAILGAAAAEREYQKCMALAQPSGRIN